MDLLRRFLIIWTEMLQLMGFTSKVGYKFGAKSRYPKIKRKGHILLSPTEKQRNEYYIALLRKTRIEQWYILKSEEFYTNFAWPQRPESIIDKIIVTSTNSAIWGASKLYDVHTDIGYQGETLPGIATHIFLNTSGIIERVSAFTNIIRHTRGANLRSLSLTIQTGMDGISNKMQTGLERALTLLCLQKKLNPYKAIRGLREVKTRKIPFLKGETNSDMLRRAPGLLVLMDVVRINVAVDMQKKLKYAGLYGGEIDGNFNRETKLALKKFDARVLQLSYKEPDI